MTHQYEITGMTCSHCVARVQKSIAEHPDVTDVKVSLDSPQASISMKRHISLKELQEKVPAPYQIAEYQKTSL